MMKSVGIPIRSAPNLRRSRVSNRVSENRINVKCATERLITTCGRNLQLRAYQDGSSFFLLQKRRFQAAVRRAPSPGSSPSTSSVTASGHDRSDYLTSAGEGTASDRLAQQLEEIEKERERLVEVVETEKRRERNELERRDDLEVVAQAQAQLAVKAWEEYAQTEQFVAEAMEKNDAAFETVGEVELKLNELRQKLAILQVAISAECVSEDISCVEEAVVAAANDNLDDSPAKNANGVNDDPTGASSDEKEKYGIVDSLPIIRRFELWWINEGFEMEEALQMILGSIEKTETAYEKAKADRSRAEEFSIGVAKSAREAEDLAKAADKRANDAMALVQSTMETVLAARIAAAAAEEEIFALDKRVSALLGEKNDSSLSPSDEQDAVWVMTSLDCAENDDECKESAAAALDAVKMIPASIDANIDIMEKDVVTKEKKDWEDGKAEVEKEKVEKPKVAASSKQFAGKWFSSETTEMNAVGIAAVLGLGLAVGSLTPGAAPVRRAMSNSSSQVATSLKKGWTAITLMIPESERKIAEHAAHEAHEAGLTDALVLLFTSILAVTLVSKIPGGSPVLGFLLGGAAVGPYTTGLVGHVAQAQVLAEFGVVFLLFNIGLELSLERLQSMAKYIFGMGSAQMVMTTMLCAAAAIACGLTIPQSVVVGMGLAFSSTAVALQVLQDRGEAGTRHGRGTFSVLLFQDLTVVLVFMLVPLLAGPDSGSVAAIIGSLAKAIVKTVAAIGAIMTIGRTILRPIYSRIAKLGKAEVLTATTLFTALGTSLLTQSIGLSMALGAFLAGLLLAETEFHLQVESDIAPFRGLLLGLFFMTVGMQIDPTTLFANFNTIVTIASGLLAIKMGVMAICGPAFGLNLLVSLRAGVYIAPGGEFAFVTYGIAAAAGLLSMDIVNQINLAVVLTMAATPMLANVGANLKKLLKKEDSVASLQAKEGDVDDLSGHVIIAGYGRVGRMIGELLGEQLIPFVAVDVSAEDVQKGRDMDAPVYFGDAGSPAVLHAVGAEKASCAVVTLDSPGANYRTVWALNKYYPNIKVYVRARDIDDGLALEKAGAKAVVPETLEPSLQLGAAVLNEMEMSNEDISIAVDNFRRSHMGDLQMLANRSGSALGYGLPSNLEALKSYDAGEEGTVGKDIDNV
mmetsp:Transcript_13030/g.55063  ORF Transcript_13030/g.55063 Transcript_13030/m.55063 type:complete len:1143 (-) Transcript_13030:1075-4503(-)